MLTDEEAKAIEARVAERLVEVQRTSDAWQARCEAMLAAAREAHEDGAALPPGDMAIRRAAVAGSRVVLAAVEAAYHDGKEPT